MLWPRVDEEVVPLTLVHRVLHQSTVQGALMRRTSAESRENVCRTQMSILSKVCSVEGEQEGGQDSPLGGSPVSTLSGQV